MLDSLVRVSRRVGWKADKLTTDPERKTPTCPTSRRGAVGRHGCPVSASRDSPGRPESRKGRRGRASVPERPAPRGYNSARRSARLPSPRACGRPETGRGAPPVESAHGGARLRWHGRVTEGSRTAPPRTARRAEFHELTLRIHPFTSERLHVLLNSLFKVLFNFPSRYLSAIGLVSVFSLRWSLPPTLGCIHKQPDSEDALRDGVRRR